MVMFSENLAVRPTEKGDRTLCLKCGRVVCLPHENWRLHVRVDDIDPGPVWPWHPSHTRAPSVADAVYREYFCPGCGSMFDVECVPRALIEEPIRQDVVLRRFAEPGLE